MIPHGCTQSDRDNGKKCITECSASQGVRISVEVCPLLAQNSKESAHNYQHFETKWDKKNSRRITKSFRVTNMQMRHKIESHVWHKENDIMCMLPEGRRDAAWYLAPAPLQHFLGRTLPGSKAWWVVLSVPPDPESAISEQIHFKSVEVATTILHVCPCSWLLTRQVQCESDAPSFPSSAKRPCPWCCTGAQRTTSPSVREFGTPSQKGLFPSILPATHNKPLSCLFNQNNKSLKTSTVVTFKPVRNKCWQ